jgi:hypothetical protein
VALLAATMLALAAVGPASAAAPKGEWVTWFASDTLPAGTWPVGTYDAANHPFYVLHETWTLPTPGADQFTAGPRNGPYTVGVAPLYPGSVLLRLGTVRAVVSGGVSNPVCGDITAINSDQPTRIVIGETTGGTQMTLAEWQKDMATTALTATLGDGPGWKVPLMPVKTEALQPAEDSCQFAVSRATSRSLFEGDWTATDHFDGSTELLNVASGSTPAVTYTDLYASVCANAGARSTVFDASGKGTISGTELDVTYSRAGCGSYQYPATSMTFTYDPATDTMLDNYGDTWHRQVEGPIAPCPPGTNCAQVTSGSGTQATLVADPGTTWTPLFGASYFGPAIPGGNCTSGGPLEPNGVLGFQLTGTTQTKLITLALDPALVTHGIAHLKVCWSQATPFTSVTGALVTIGDLPDCHRGRGAPCVLSRTSGKHNAAFITIRAPAADPSDPYGYGHW